MFLFADPQGGMSWAESWEGSTGNLMLNISALVVKQMMTELQLPETCVMGSFQTLTVRKMS